MKILQLCFLVRVYSPYLVRDQGFWSSLGAGAKFYIRCGNRKSDCHNYCACNGPSLCIIGSHVFEPCPPVWCCYRPLVMRKLSLAFMFNLSPSHDSLRSFSLLRWLKKRVPSTRQSRRELSCSWLPYKVTFLSFFFSMSQPGLFAPEGSCVSVIWRLVGWHAVGQDATTNTLRRWMDEVPWFSKKDKMLVTLEESYWMWTKMEAICT